MSFATKIVPIVTMFFITSMTLSAGARGGESSGGGSTFHKESSVILWDFMGVNYIPKQGEAPVETLSLQVYNFDLLSSVFPRVFQEVRSRLVRLQARVPHLARQLETTMDHLPLLYLQTPIDIGGFAVSSESLSAFGFQSAPPQLKMSALYFDNYGSFFFPHLASLDFDGQVGLVVHELLRQLQIQMNFTTFQLEELTRAITFGKPLPPWIHDFLSRNRRSEVQPSPPLSQTQTQIATLSLIAIAQRCQNQASICFDEQEKRNVDLFLERLIEVLPQLSGLKPTD